MRESQRIQETGKSGNAPAESARDFSAGGFSAANADGVRDSASLDALPTLPFDGVQLRDALKARIAAQTSRIAAQTSPPLVPTRDSIPPPMIMAEEPLPLEPLSPAQLAHERLPFEAAPLPPLEAAPLPPFESAVLLPPFEPTPSRVEPFEAPPFELRRRRRSSAPPASALPTSASPVELSHPPRARKPALGRTPTRPNPQGPLDQAVRSSLQHAAATPILRLEVPAVALTGHTGVAITARRAAQIERRMTLLMLAGIGVLLVSLMALLR